MAVPRGKLLDGADELAGYIYEDPGRKEFVYALPRDEFGLQILSGKLIGFSGWIDAALAARARAGTHQRRPRQRTMK